ncbi:MAG TPA: recombinase family protein [Streptosporangiaceae bacterium]|nr:recombinase family protein [Streptosporangiaceae bacterium]
MQTAETLTMARKLIPYSRFSGKRQEAGESQSRQDRYAEAAAREEKVEIDWTLSLKDKGISGFRGKNWKRGDLGKFLDLVDAGVIPKGSILCIEQVNRLSRMPWMDQVQLWREILQRGITIRTCVPPARYTAKNINDLTTGCPVVIYMMLANLESEQKSRWSFDAFDAAKARVRQASGQGQNVPHGLAVPDWIERVIVPHPKNPDRHLTTGYRLNEHRAALLRWMHERTQEGWGVMRLRRALVERGEPAWGRSGRWNVVTIASYLTERTAVGEYQPTRLNAEGVRVPDGPPVPNHYPVAITEECWQKTQRARAGRRGRGGRVSENANNLFTYLVHDARDGRPLHTVWWTAGPTRRQYLSTHERLWRLPYRDFERAMLTLLAKLKASDVDGRHQADALTARVEAIQDQRSALGIELDALNRQLDELPPSRWPRRAVAQQAELEEAVAAKDEELRQAKEAAATSTRTEALIDLRNSLKALDQARQEGRHKDEQAIRHRIKGRVPFLVESIWVRMEAHTKQSRYAHVRVYLHGGEQRPFVLTFGAPKLPPLNLRDADFRGGEERGHALRPQRAAKALAV